MFAAEQLLNPIRADQPAGEDLAFSPELDAITLARKFDDPSLDQGEWVTDIKEADWDFVVTRCAALLEQKSKDLRLGVWLAEAAAKKHQLRGLGESFRVLAGLIEQYWDRGLYPEAEDDDHDQRIGNLSWILGRTPALLREMRITEGTRGYTLVDFEVARKLANASGGNSSYNNNPGAPAGLKLADLEKARSANSAKFRETFTADAQYCLDALRQFEQAADERLGHDSPGFSNAREAVQDMVTLMPAPSAAPAEAVAAPGDFYYAEPENDQGPPGAPQPAGPPGVIRTREQAVTQLRNVAEFFRRTEPHSPASYFADKAADAANTDLHAWLRSVVKDSGAMAHIEELLGVKPPQDD
ncbi:type VI secretion system protein TssA [Massilia pseudoviolaceinigra]|uniref:type VI secretion system protein TssA n=1 Tax=Massilia pseudoviolaceinigra TaxID=3057165 RepID=UPI002796A131|nr:type VI secretion system protein TssA [Massilia sp. CCM 9206]MDQ1921789.1 type VI secretion system protein TssA [Massilia sp. CCM 9206]